MKRMRKLLMTGAVCVMMVMGAQAQEVTVVGGTATLPHGITMQAISQTELVKGTLAMEAVKGMAAADTWGKHIDIYQLSGEDGKGVKTAWLIGVDMKDQPNMAKNATGIMEMTKSPALETLMLAQVNGILPNLESQINEYINRDQKTGKVVKPYNKSVQFENMEQATRATGTKYPTYTMGSRVLVDAYGFQLPYYVQGFVVMQESGPVAYMSITADVEREYFRPMVRDFIGSLQ